MTAARINDFELEEADELLCHIDPRDDDPRPEEKRQLAFLRDMKALCPAVIVFAVPNGGKRTQWAAMKAKREGMRAGVVDLICVWNRGVAFIEMKDGRSMPTPAQREFLNSLWRAGHHVGVFRQERSALDWLLGLGVPTIARKTVNHPPPATPSGASTKPSTGCIALPSSEIGLRARIDSSMEHETNEARS